VSGLRLVEPVARGEMCLKAERSEVPMEIGI